MDCSVVVCTRNRASQLVEALTSFTELNIPAGTAWEVVVVDNGSTDSTAEVVRSFEERLPIRRVFEPKAGISNARNAATAAAQGKYIVWTDDDVHVDPNWLAAFLEAFKRWPEAAVFGGRIILNLVPPTPDWFRDDYEHLKKRLAARDFGPDPLPLSIEKDHIPYGACYAVRADVHKQYRYDPEMGRSPGRNLAGEETGVIEAILKDNHPGWYVPQAEVKHIIQPYRQRLDHIIQLYEETGENWAHLEREDRSLRLWGIPLSVWLKFPISYLRFRLAYALGSKSWPHYLGRLAWYRGVFRYCLREQPIEKWADCNLKKYD